MAISKFKRGIAKNQLLNYVTRVLDHPRHSLRFHHCIDILVKEHSLIIPEKCNKKEWFFQWYYENENVLKFVVDNFYSTVEWKTLRKQVLSHYGNACMKCGLENDSNCVDHIEPRSIHKELELEFNNLQVLCNICNLVKSNRNSIDYRKF